MNDGPMAEFRGVSKVYRRGGWAGGEVSALHDVSLRVARSEVLGLVGPNRSGKTTLAKLLLGLCRPTTGHVERLGRPASDHSTLGRVGYLHEQPALPRYLDGRAALAYFGTLAGVGPDVLGGRVTALLERVGLRDRDREPISRFSKGMLQRLGLAQALVNDPDLLVLDEPDAGLDLDGRRLVAEVVRERAGRGAAVLLISHAARDVGRHCDRVAVLRGGRLVHCGACAELGRGAAFERSLGALCGGGAR